MSDPTVVVGAGLAGVRTVQALRRRGYDAPITLVSAESHLPYDRPPLSKEFLLGKAGATDIALCTAAELADLDIDLRLETRGLRSGPAHPDAAAECRAGALRHADRRHRIDTTNVAGL